MTDKLLKQELEISPQKKKHQVKHEELYSQKLEKKRTKKSRDGKTEWTKAVLFEKLRLKSTM